MQNVNDEKRDQALKSYRALRGMPADQLGKEAISKMLKTGNLKNLNVTPEAFQLVHKIAMNTDEKNWTEFLETKELPAMKLTHSELEVLKGGCWGFLLRFFLDPSNFGPTTNYSSIGGGWA